MLSRFALNCGKLIRVSVPKRRIMLPSVQRQCGMIGRGYSSGVAERDSEYARYITSEINDEKRIAEDRMDDAGVGDVLQDFEVVRDGAEVTLKKMLGNESIEIVFNVNNTVAADDGLTAPNDESSANLASRPNFTVVLSRSLTSKFMINCVMQQPEAVPIAPSGDHSEEGGDMDNAMDKGDGFEIIEVAFMNDEVKESTYFVNSINLDDDMYDMMLSMLHDRGINAEFAAELVRFATKHEHDAYIKLLQNLKSFLNEKAE